MIPVATTTIALLASPSADEYAEPYSGDQPADREVVASGIRAVIDAPRGTEQTAGGEQSRVQLRLICDPCPANHRHLVRDETTGAVYRLTWIVGYPDMGTGDAHIEGGLEIVEGLV